MNTEGVDPEDIECKAEPHPEGAKRGGYVPVVYADDNEEALVFFDSTPEEWYGYDG